MLTSPNARSAADREKIVAALVPSLADLLDLAGMAKLAHWHVRGPGASALHGVYDDLAKVCRKQADRIAERAAIALGGVVIGTASQVAERSRLDPFPAEARSCEELCAALTDRARQASAGLGETRRALDALKAVDTANMIQDIAVAVDAAAGFVTMNLDT